ncbi:DUF4242 domain-containing protein [Nocardioides immobilis]|uniref:DUF4242 domain-containing protein n=1 Tax=Nocardioides immobilis TaxID=2049295 RepID=A0A417Y429_9ACTN|nr:nickel-binding protein [Nocardioides immobilis]RHW27399.1 DUF4242 domain-containing protein [Nocardioides immobilis]
MSRGLPDSDRPGPPYVPRIDTIREHQVFLVERYQPGATLADVRASVARLDALRSQHGTVRHVSSTLVPREEAVFALFVADSVDAVIRLNRAAGLQVDRVVTGVYLTAGAHVEGVP